LSNRPTRRHYRFKDCFTGSIDHLGTSHLCQVEEISQRGLYLLSDIAANVGDRMSVDLHISKDVRFSCVIEIRRVTSDGIRAEIVDIADVDADVLNARIEEHCAAAGRAKAARARAVRNGN
jgi:hypothetical protein